VNPRLTVLHLQSYCKALMQVEEVQCSQQRRFSLCVSFFISLGPPMWHLINSNIIHTSTTNTWGSGCLQTACREKRPCQNKMTRNSRLAMTRKRTEIVTLSLHHTVHALSLTLWSDPISFPIWPLPLSWDKLHCSFLMFYFCHIVIWCYCGQIRIA
jgi:hypothetical protein